MPYTPPAGNAANFTTPTPVFPPAFDNVNYRFPVGSYFPPAGDAIAAQFPAGYFVAGDAADFTAYGDEVFSGTGAVSMSVRADGDGVHGVTGSGAVALAGVTAEGYGLRLVQGSGVVALAITPAGEGVHGVAGSGAAAVRAAPAGAGTVVRYEVRGVVLDEFVAVAREVRVHRRDTGEMVGAAMSSPFGFRIHVGFEAREHYLVPIDTDPAAEDFAPPCSNRVLSVLAMD